MGQSSSPNNFFIVQTAGRIQKIQKGLNPDEVIQILGKPLKIAMGKTQRGKRIFFKLRPHIYELVFIEDRLEVCIKINKKIT